MIILLKTGQMYISYIHLFIHFCFLVLLSCSIRLALFSLFWSTKEFKRKQKKNEQKHFLLLLLETKLLIYFDHQLETFL